MGIWIRSQDKTTLTFCRTVNSLGKDYIHLGDYETLDRAQEVLAIIADFVECKSNDSTVFQMPLN